MNKTEMTAQDVGIAGALLQPLGVISTDGGPVLHMVYADRQRQQRSAALLIVFACAQQRKKHTGFGVRILCKRSK